MADTLLRPRSLILGLELDALTMDQTVDRCHDALRSRDPVLIGVVNAAKVVNLRDDTLLRRSLLDCDLLLADGQSVVWASRILRYPLPERVTGIDLFQRLLALADAERLRIYLLGAQADVLRHLVEVITQQYPGAQVVGAHDGYFTDVEAQDVADDIRSTHADLLFLGMTSPKKEVFLSTYAKDLDVPVMHGVGGSFDILAGVTRRAPQHWQRMGLEWAYRLLQEPRRLVGRYTRTNTAFIGLVARELYRATPPYRSLERSDA